MSTRVETEFSLHGLRVLRQEHWASQHVGLVQGITLRDPGLDFSPTVGAGTAEPDRSAPRTAPLNGWDHLQQATGIPRVARCRQVHGAMAVIHDRLHDGVEVLGEADAIITSRAGLLLAVTVADCVPVFFVDPVRRRLGLAHAGWRGTAEGVVQATIDGLRGLGSDPDSLLVHLGPAICGRCYEVGPEVIAALGIPDSGSTRIDLRRHIARSVVEAGVPPGHLTASEDCTRCDERRFFSYRGGDKGQRMCAFLGWTAG